MKYKYIAKEQSVDERYFEIFSDKKLSEEEIEDALALPDIDKVGNFETEGSVKVTYLHTEYGDDSKVDYYIESIEHNLVLLEGGKS
tara:strand:+ start:1061 stop:1318 length:258 start_codon:yes stop_codon:yes gene_type:complete